MKNFLLINLILIIVTASFCCKSQSKTKKIVTTDTVHTSQTSLDWDGIYRGVLPCADCRGIQKTVYLNRDGSYLVKTKYLGKGDSARESSGTLTWNNRGNTITL